MDRRTLLAFALMFLVFLGYQALIRRDMPDTPPATTEQTEAAAVEGPADVAPAQQEPTDWQQQSESSQPQGDVAQTPEAMLQPVTPGSGPEARVKVITPLYEIHLAGRGARITNWLGGEFTNTEGQPLELIPQDDQSVPYGMDAVVFNATEMELGRLAFETDAPAELTVGDGATSVVFKLRTQGDLEIRKIYTFRPDSYEITLDLEIHTVGEQATTARAVLGTPLRARFGWLHGIASTEGGDRLEKAAFRSFAKVGDELEIKKRGNEIKKLEKVTGSYAGSVLFAGLQNKYFTVIGLSGKGLDQGQEGKVILSGDQPRNLMTWSIEQPLQTGTAVPGALASSRLFLFIGPQDSEILKSYGIGLEKTMDLGWALFRPMTEATLWIMDQMRRFIPNYGLIIILFSVLTKLAFYPLTRTSTQSMKRMQMLQPKIKALQEKHKDNQEKQSKEMMELYKKEKVNPAAGCLPLLLQMPVFVALYQALAHTIALRNTPFVWWIQDLSKPDALFSFPFTLPFLGAEFNLLPILMGVTMVIQTRLTPTGQPTGQMAMMNTMMPVIFLFMFYQMPSGLVLYWLVNNLMTIFQTWRIHQTATPEGGTETT